ncbi:unnamed protein product [Diamesa tonsa]
MFYGKLETIGNFTQLLIKGLRSDSEYEEYFENSTEDDGVIVVWETAVQPLTDIQRIIFAVFTVLVSFVAIVGNILVLYVNFSRKQRLLFRTCLISLAVSDLIFVIVTCFIYIPKFATPNSALWLLGPLSCALIPFTQTLAVLVNSILLVSIAMDRYMAVVRIIKGNWDPGLCFCLTCVILIWGMCAGVSSPMLTIYDHYKIFIVPVPDEMEIDPVLTYYEGYLCGSDKDENTYYFVIIFTFIFLPLLTTFLWLNSILAKEIWNRREPIQVEKRPVFTVSMDDSTVVSSNTETGNNAAAASNVHNKTTKKKSQTPNESLQVNVEFNTKKVERKQRQIRMVKVIALLMAVFFICRLPNWIYVLYKLSNVTQKNIYWVIHYIFGILVLVNCLLNPFLYTFLSETIRLTTFLLNLIVSIFRPCKNMCRKNTRIKEPNIFST